MGWVSKRSSLLERGCRGQLDCADEAPPHQQVSVGTLTQSAVTTDGEVWSPGHMFFPHFFFGFSRIFQALDKKLMKMQQALVAVGRVGVALSFVSPSWIPLHATVLTNSGCLGGSPTTATKPGRLSYSRVPIRAASQEAFSEMELEKKKCVPCETGKLQPLSTEKAHSLLPEVSGWELKEIDGVLQLHRNWKAKSFVKGLEIMKRVADVAEAEGHHPDLHLVNWNQLSINISTHAVGGLTENDFIVAAKIGALDLADLVRKPKAVAK